MPAYIKWYCVFAVYLALWAAGTTVVYTYNVIKGGENTARDMIFIIFAYTLFILAFVKGLVSIKACKRYRQSAMLTTAERDVFMASFCYIILFAAGMLLVSVFDIQADLVNNYQIISGATILADVCVVLTAVAGIYFSITDLILLKAIRKKYEESLLRRMNNL